MIYIIYFFALIGFLVVALIGLIWFYNYTETKKREVVYGSCSPCSKCGRNTQDGIPCRYCGY